MIENDKILKIDIENEMKSAYIDYSMSVIVARALPDVRDGMKPVHRRVLFGMNKMGATFDKPRKKSAKCVGEVMGNYHPHGDSSIYGTLVRMAQDWSLRYTLVDGQGNFGSIDADPPAAMRYTEARLSKIADDMLADIDFETVDFQPTYDNTNTEPTVLPTRIPNLLVNGASGIAVGMATNMAPHNLSEAIDASVALLENPELTIPQLMKFIPAPDFPTGGTIYGYAGVQEAYATGRGRIVVRAKADIENEGNHELIVIKEIPYGVVKSDLITYIADLVNEKKLEGIADINDESDYKGMRIVIKLKSDANSNVVLNKLYKMTQMQSSFSVNNVALVNGRPKTLNLKELLAAFIEHRHDVVIRRTRYELRKAQEKAHIREGLLIAVQNIKEVIDIITTSETSAEAKGRLTERFGLTDAQTTAILDMRLSALTHLQTEKLRAEIEELHKRIEELELILSDDSVCRELIKSELLEVKEKYGDGRRTEIDYTAGDFNAEDFYSDNDVIITISHLGYIKRTNLTEFRAQNRGGVGAKGSDTRDTDFIEHIYMASMHCTMLFFTDKGLVYNKKVYELPEMAKNAKGRALQNLLNIEPGDSIRAVIACKQLSDAEYTANHYLVFATRNGLVKKTQLSEYARIMAKGKKAIVIREDDALIDVKLTDGNSDIMLASRNGRAVKFDEKGLRSMGRVSAGVRGMKLTEKGDRIVGLITLNPDSSDDVMVISEKGFGKRSKFEDYPRKRRGGKGVKTFNISEKTGHLAGCVGVNDNEDLVIINQSGITLRFHVSDIRTTGRATQGVRIINLDKRGDIIAAVCVVDSDPEQEVEEVIEGEVLPAIPEELGADDDADDDDADDDATDSSDIAEGDAAENND